MAQDVISKKRERAAEVTIRVCEREREEREERERKRERARARERARERWRDRPGTTLRKASMYTPTMMLKIMNRTIIKLSFVSTERTNLGCGM